MNIGNTAPNLCLPYDVLQPVLEHTDMGHRRCLWHKNTSVFTVYTKGLIQYVQCQYYIWAAGSSLARATGVSVQTWSTI